MEGARRMRRARLAHGKRKGRAGWHTRSARRPQPRPANWPADYGGLWRDELDASSCGRVCSARNLTIA